jgi:hypothetical protein
MYRGGFVGLVLFGWWLMRNTLAALRAIRKVQLSSYNNAMIVGLAAAFVGLIPASFVMDSFVVRNVPTIGLTVLALVHLQLMFWDFESPTEMIASRRKPA